ncbi:MAG: tRNA (adenosine(37)-N6)-threonylcarbamoyltransferase complex transferase subunit TsaD [Clostridia bacterium]|nr:tRNA (adenosine(37)-N6)-threonylcarbamoyltransferase complex transferase subunit TsaD [Clostridia bacterium]
MIILAIESSCDDTAAAVVQDGQKILSSVVASQIEKHQKFGGVFPELASRNHIAAISQITESALSQAKLRLDDIDALAVTHAPGLIGSLLVGVNFIKGLSLSTGLPVIPVHHLRSHIAANYLSDPQFSPPFLCLVVSGGHSHIVEVKDYCQFKVIGKTRDDAAGETFDKAARSLGLPYPGGVLLDELAELGNEDAFKFSKPKLTDSGYDFSFSGLKTSIINQIHNLQQKKAPIPTNDLCASFRKVVVDYLLGNFIKAAEDLHYRKLAIAGGVSANSLLRQNLSKICTQRDWHLSMPEKSLCGDNASMVGAQAYFEFLRGNIANFSLNAFANMSIEDVIFF